MADITYTFPLPGRYAGKSVSVYDAAGTQMATPTASSDAVVTITLAEGDYHLLTADGLYMHAGTTQVSQTALDQAVDVEFARRFAQLARVNRVARWNDAGTDIGL